jgi:signal peptidase
MEGNKASHKQNTAALSFKKIFGNLLFALLLLIAALLVISLLSVKISGGPPAVAGHHLYIVLSGSMSPAFDAGSLVFVKPTPAGDIQEGDIITYRGLGDSEKLISHRVVEINLGNDGPNFTTKGDANEVIDPNPVLAKNLVGKVTLAIPYLGYCLEFIQTKQGLLLLIIMPASLVLLLELGGLYKRLRKKDMNNELSKETHTNTKA